MKGSTLAIKIETTTRHLCYVSFNNIRVTRHDKCKCICKGFMLALSFKITAVYLRSTEHGCPTTLDITVKAYCNQDMSPNFCNHYLQISFLTKQLIESYSIQFKLIILQRSVSLLRVCFSCYTRVFYGSHLLEIIYFLNNNFMYFVGQSGFEKNSFETVPESILG